MASQAFCQCQRAAPPGLIARLIRSYDLDVSGIADRPRGLTAEQEADLFALIREGDDDAKLNALQALIGNYLQVIIAIAKLCQQWYRSCYHKPGASLGNLIAVGRNGFIRAVEMHDFDLCGEFSVCAVEAIKTAILYSLLPGRRRYERV